MSQLWLIRSPKCDEQIIHLVYEQLITRVLCHVGTDGNHKEKQELVRKGKIMSKRENNLGGAEHAVVSLWHNIKVLRNMQLY